MKILKINNTQPKIMLSRNNLDTAYISGFNVKMQQPLQADTISFHGKSTNAVSKEIKAALARKEARALRDARQIYEAKHTPSKTNATKKNLDGEERTWGVEYQTAVKIHNMIQKPQQQVHEFMGKIFGDLKVSDISPKNLLLDFSDRAKSEVSIMEKSATRKWNSIKEVMDEQFGMTDLNGAKIVMNYKTGKNEVEMVLSRLIPLIKTGHVTLHEIELQRPIGISKKGDKIQEEFDYASKVFLDKLEDAQEEVLNGLETDVDKIKLINRPLPKYTKFNYCALHLLLQINEKGSRPFELQIMGAREAKGKYFDDKRWKKFDGKQLDKMYEPLVRLWEPLMADSNVEAKERFLEYCKDANLLLREDEIHENKTQKLLTRSSGFFKSIREYDLPPEYDLNEQYKLMQTCEARAAAEKKKKESKQKIQQKNSLLTKVTISKLLEKFGSRRGSDKNKKIKN